MPQKRVVFDFDIDIDIDIDFSNGGLRGQASGSRKARTWWI